MGSRSRRARPVAAAGLVLAALPAFGEAEHAAGGPVLEEIVVTGSRIARDHDHARSLPVQSVTAEEIRASGEFSLAEVVDDLPALLRSVTAERSLGSGFGDGANVLDLRGLGAERTLVLVDGRRHVGGLQGASSVDIGSIPAPLVERVDVLTGGASAVYGADAVTGVVNFVLRDDYEGFEVDAHYGLSEYADGEQAGVAAVWGRNLLDGRANLTVALDLRDDDGLRVGDRADGRLIGSARDWVNPALRFQRGDIGAATPNFARYYDYANTGLLRYGLPIPTAEDFAADFMGAFGAAPDLTAAETALIERAADAPQRAVLPGRAFPITSGYGHVVPGNPFTGRGFDPEVDIDLDGNGVPDCLDSFTGYNSVFGAASLGVAGGCWSVGADGTYRPVRDGLVAGSFQGFGGDSFDTLRSDDDHLVLPDGKAAVTLMGNFDLTARARLFGELKYASQDTATDARPNSFWDLLFGAADNPFLPGFLRDVADATGGVAITVDPVFFDARRATERETVRAVAGIEGEWRNGWTYGLSLNHGRYRQRTDRTGQVIVDRFFAAIDAVTDPATGRPACRADVDPQAPAMNTPFRIPAYQAGYYSFTPGAGDCVPLNIWAGRTGVSPAAAAWVTTPERTDVAIGQSVASATLAGTLARLMLPGGAVEFAFGAELRRETAATKHDAWQRGVLPAGAPFPAGTLLGAVSDNESLTFRPQIGVKNESGAYDARDVFVEVSLPLLADVAFAREVSVDVAARWSDYSTVGGTGSWKANAVWAPADGLAFRGGVSRAVRAPNIAELFRPEIGQNFRPVDPCDAAQIEALLAEDPELGGNFLRNCAADLERIGLDPFDADGNYRFADPLSASFGGIASGNPDLREETARTTTYGVAFQPSWLPDLRLSVDFWDIEIEDAIESVTGQNIVDGCYRGAVLNPEFCGLFTRNDDPASAQFGGFDFLRTADINFARLRTRGIDFRAGYRFALGGHRFDVTVAGTRVDRIDFHTSPGDRDDVDPELGEAGRPELAGNIHLRWDWGRLGVDWRSRYLGGMLLGFLEIETAGRDAIRRCRVHGPDLGARPECPPCRGRRPDVARRRQEPHRGTAVPHRPRLSRKRPGPHVLPARGLSAAVGVTLGGSVAQRFRQGAGRTPGERTESPLRARRATSPRCSTGLLAPRNRRLRLRSRPSPTDLRACAVLRRLGAGGIGVGTADDLHHGALPAVRLLAQHLGRDGALQAVPVESGAVGGGPHAALEPRPVRLPGVLG